MQDRRTTARDRAFSTASLSWPACERAGAEGAGVDGVLRDLSGGGAMLLLDAPMRLPQELDLATARHGVRRVRVVWRGAGAVGVAFVAPTPAEPVEVSRNDAAVVSLAEARAARRIPSDADRLAARIAAVLRRSERPRPGWV